MKKGASIILFLIIAISANAQSNYIPEVSPADIYGSLEKDGFTTEEKLDSGSSNSWISQYKYGGSEYIVEVSSDNINKVQDIRATVKNFNTTESESIQFFQNIIVAFLLQNDKDRREVDKWVSDNFKDGDTASIGSVSLIIEAPSDTIRVLNISANR